MHHLEPGSAHHPIGIEVRIRRKLRGSNPRWPGGMRIEPTLRVSVNIKLNLTDTAIERLRQRLMLVVKALVSVRILRLPDLAFVRRNAGVIAVVRTDDLNLIEFQCAVSSLSPDHGNVAGQNRSK